MKVGEVWLYRLDYPTELSNYLRVKIVKMFLYNGYGLKNLEMLEYICLNALDEERNGIPISIRVDEFLDSFNKVYE